MSTFTIASQSYRIGYIYIPAEAPGTDASIGNWYGNAYAFANVPENFVKIAHVEASAPEDPPFPLYVNATEHPLLLISPFVTPRGWREVGVYTDHDGSVRKVIRQHATPTWSSLAASTGIDIRRASSISSLSTNIVSRQPRESTLSTTTTKARKSELPSSDQYDSRVVLFKSVLQQLQLGNFEPFTNSMSSNIESLTGPYITCNATVFQDGIQYSTSFFKAVFPAAWVIIMDARMKFRSALYRELGLTKDQKLLESHATSYLSEISTLSTAMGQPVEQGLQCRSTNRTVALFLTSPDIIQLVAEDERQSFSRSLRTYALALVQDVRRLSLGGWAINDFDGVPGDADRSQLLKERIFAALGITTHDGQVNSIQFTRQESQPGKPFRRTAILAMIAHHLLRAPRDRDRSVIDMFPDDFSVIPDMLICSACAYIICAFRASFPGAIDTIPLDMVVREQLAMQRLLRDFREGTPNGDSEVDEFNKWVSTKDGESGWLIDLQRALSTANKQRGPKN